MIFTFLVSPAKQPIRNVQGTSPSFLRIHMIINYIAMKFLVDLKSKVHNLNLTIELLLIEISKPQATEVPKVAGSTVLPCLSCESIIVYPAKILIIPQVNRHESNVLISCNVMNLSTTFWRTDVILTCANNCSPTGVTLSKLSARVRVRVANGFFKT
jgi:hypothetical protein